MYVKFKQLSTVFLIVFVALALTTNAVFAGSSRPAQRPDAGVGLQNDDDCQPDEDKDQLGTAAGLHNDGGDDDDCEPPEEDCKPDNDNDKLSVVNNDADDDDDGKPDEDVDCEPDDDDEDEDKEPSEVLYLSNTGTRGDGTSGLYTVAIDEVSLQAVLTLLPNGIVNYDWVDSLAVTPDGAWLYLIDDHPAFKKATLVAYEVQTGGITEIGVITLNGAILYGFDQMAFSPDGTLYAGNTLDETIYILDPVTAGATPVGVVTDSVSGSVVDLSGADIAFTNEGVFYIYANPAAAPRGLYTLALPAVSGQVLATFIGAGPDPHDVRGFAFRDNGAGEIAAATREDEIHIINKATSENILTLPLILDGTVFDLRGGDMANSYTPVCVDDDGDPEDPDRLNNDNGDENDLCDDD